MFPTEKTDAIDEVTLCTAALWNAMETKVGIDNSADPASLDYMLRSVSGGHDHDGIDSKQVSYANLTNVPTTFTPSSHTHPASEIASGTLLHERGGLEADISAYSGLVKVSGGVTSQVTDNSTNWSTAYGWGNHAGLYSLLGHDHSGVYSPVGHNHSGVYEPVLGNPSGDNYLLKSSALGVRGWTDPATFATAGHNHAGVYETSGAVSTHAALTTGIHGLAITAGQTLTVTSGGTLGSAAYTNSTAYEASGAIATHAGLTTGIHGLAITAGQTLTVTSGGTIGSAAYTASGNYTPVAHKTTEDAINGLVFVNGAGAYSAKTIGSDVQAYHANLASLAGLAFVSTSFVKMTAAGTFGLDTNTYSLSSHNHSGVYEPVNSSLSAISAGTWTGASSITTLGTIATGTWNATAISWAKVDKTGSNLTDIATRSHTSLSDIGTNSHSSIDTHIAATGTSAHGLGTMSTQASNNVSISGGSITGITDLAIADGGTGASTAAGARSGLALDTGNTPQFAGLGIGTPATSVASIRTINSPVNPTSITYGLLLTISGASTSTGTHYTRGLAISNVQSVSTGVTNSGYNYGFSVDVWRNANTSTTDDSGTLTDLIGARFLFGHFLTNPTANPHTTNVYGFYITPYYYRGVITNLYGLYIASAGTISTPSTWTSKSYVLSDIVKPTVATGYYYVCTTAGASGGVEPSPWNTTEGGTTNDGAVVWTTIIIPAVTTTWGIYQAGTGINNYLASNILLGTTSAGTSAAKTLGIGNGTAPTTSPADMVQMWAADYAAGDSRLYLKSEAQSASGNAMILGNSTIIGGAASGGNLSLLTTTHATKGLIYFGTASVYDQVNDRFGIGITSPDRKLEIIDATSPQLRLTHTDNTDYCDFQVDTSGWLQITPSGSYVQIFGDVDLNVVGVYRVNTTQVVGVRVIDARIDDVINSGDATTDGVIDAIRDALITHGLVAAA